jgi:biopolymer transport protein TolR
MNVAGANISGGGEKPARRKPIVIKPAMSLNGDINVTPLVDVVLVLLIIFMVVIPLQERSLPVDIPATERAEADTPPPPNQTLVRIDEQNKIFINDVEVAPQALVQDLKTRIEQRPSGSRVVFFIADDRARFKLLVTAFDAAMEAGADSIAYATGDDTAEPPPSAPPAAAPPAP